MRQNENKFKNMVSIDLNNDKNSTIKQVIKNNYFKQISDNQLNLPQGFIFDNKIEEESKSYDSSDKFGSGNPFDSPFTLSIKKNKEIILDINFFLKNGFKETFNAALYGKTIYIIDEEEIKKRKIKLKQVSVMSNYIEE